MRSRRSSSSCRPGSRSPWPRGRPPIFRSAGSGPTGSCSRSDATSWRSTRRRRRPSPPRAGHRLSGDQAQASPSAPRVGSRHLPCGPRPGAGWTSRRGDGRGIRSRGLHRGLPAVRAAADPRRRGRHAAHADIDPRRGGAGAGRGRRRTCRTRRSACGSSPARTCSSASSPGPRPRIATTTCCATTCGRSSSGASPERRPELHGRAAAWYAECRPARARDRACDRERRSDAAAQLVEAATLRTYRQGHSDRLERWLADFDDRAFERRPCLAVGAALVHALSGRPETAEHLADIVERSEFSGAPANGSASFESVAGDSSGGHGAQWP